ncbi:MAG: HAD hydrolase family protein [Nitrospirota bacterium]
MKRKRIIAFDLEGPLSPMDHAMEVMGIVPEGEKVFAVLSRYDDLLTIEGRAGYEPGDTLVLIFPFLLLHRIKPEDLIEVSKRAGLVKGSKELVSELKKDGWDIYIISTSYCQHARSIGDRLGVEKGDIFCTDLTKIDFDKKLDRETESLLKETENYILSNLYSNKLDSGEKDLSIKPYLDRFFWHELKSTSIGHFMNDIKVMGGTKKREALEGIAERDGITLKDIVAVGDSITDFPMLKAVNEAGGLAIVFNGNEFSLPYGTVSVASTDLRDIRLLVDKWVENGREGVRQVFNPPSPSLLKGGKGGFIGEGPYYHWLEGLKKEEMDEIKDAVEGK